MLVIEIWVMQIGSGEGSVRSFAQVVMDIVTDLNSSSEFAFWLRLSDSQTAVLSAGSGSQSLLIMLDSDLVACLVDKQILTEPICEACCNTAKLVLEETVHGDETWERFLLVMGKTALILRCGHWPGFDDLEVGDLAPMAKQKTVKRRNFKTDPLDEKIAKEFRLVIEITEKILMSNHYVNEDGCILLQNIACLCAAFLIDFA